MRDYGASRFQLQREHASLHDLPLSVALESKGICLLESLPLCSLSLVPKRTIRTSLSRYAKRFASRGGKARAARLSREARQEIARKAAQARWKGKNSSGEQHPRPPSGEPEIIRRLCARRDQDGRPLEYTFVKMIVMDAPLDPLTTLLVHPAAESDPMAALFRKKTYGRILARIDVEEQEIRSLSLVDENTKAQILRKLAFLRQQVYQSLVGEPELLKQGRGFMFTFVPTGFDDGRPLYINPDVRVQVWASATHEGEQPTLLGEEIIRPGEAYASEFSQAVHHLLQAHCDLRKLMRLRFRSAWWTKRPSPTAFPVVTKYLIPRLYDYLRPYYETRSYTVSLSRRGPGAFPRQLMKDIADVLRLERPDLCQTLTWAGVQAAVSRYLDEPTTRPDRPMGYEMFGVDRKVVERRMLRTAQQEGAGP